MRLVVVSVVFAAALSAVSLVTGCKTSAGATADAGRDARAAVTDGGVDGAGATTSAGGDSSANDNGALPAATSDELTLRARHLFEAIVRDNPDLGSDLLFPRDAFVLSHDANDPGRVWDVKMATAFRRGVHTLHKRTKGVERAQFVSFEIGRTVTQATPSRHEWKEPLWHVRHARLTFTLDGREARFEISELTAWKGAWYVTKLR
ncbi:MAG TPA: hypothetical protein VGI39_21405 [Polyangiaceae bacterium]|jgi:hypothetical protein